MNGETYKIWMDAVDNPKAERLEAGWWYVPDGIYVNEYMYRTKSEAEAKRFDSAAAVRVVIDMKRHGYKARCVPSITETY
jgi:hypothetical protein